MMPLVQLGLSLFLVLVPFWGMQSYATSLGGCTDCTLYCSTSSNECVAKGHGEFRPQEAKCSWRSGSKTYCTQFSSNEDLTCPAISITNRSGTFTPVLDRCSNDTMGTFMLGVLYLTAALCCVTGYIFNLEYAIRSLAKRSVIFVCFSFALLSVVWCITSNTSSETLQYFLLFPSAVLAGGSLSFVWKAKEVYIDCECRSLPDSAKSVWFSGFLLALSLSQVVGNLAASLSVYSTMAMVMTFVLAPCLGFLLSVFLEDHSDSSDEGDGDMCGQDVHNTSGTPDSLVLVCMVYCGIEQGFTYGKFTQTIVYESVGLEGIGLIMAAYALIHVFTSVVIPWHSIFPRLLADLTRPLVRFVAIVIHRWAFEAATDAMDPSLVPERSIILQITLYLAMGDALLSMYITEHLQGLCREWFNVYKILQYLAMAFMFLTDCQFVDSILINMFLYGFIYVLLLDSVWSFKQRFF